MGDFSPRCAISHNSQTIIIWVAGDRQLALCAGFIRPPDGGWRWMRSVMHVDIHPVAFCQRHMSQKQGGTASAAQRPLSSIVCSTAAREARLNNNDIAYNVSLSQASNTRVKSIDLRKLATQGQTRPCSQGHSPQRGRCGAWLMHACYQPG